MTQLNLFDYFTKHKEECANFHDFIVDVYVERYRLFSPQALSKRFGCSVTAFHKWRVGAPSRNLYLERIAKDFDCSSEEVKIIANYFRKKLESTKAAKGVD